MEDGPGEVLGRGLDDRFQAGLLDRVRLEPFRLLQLLGGGLPKLVAVGHHGFVVDARLGPLTGQVEDAADEVLGVRAERGVVERGQQHQRPPGVRRVLVEEAGQPVVVQPERPRLALGVGGVLQERLALGAGLAGLAGPQEHFGVVAPVTGGRFRVALPQQVAGGHVSLAGLLELLLGRLRLRFLEAELPPHGPRERERLRTLLEVAVGTRLLQLLGRLGVVGVGHVDVGEGQPVPRRGGWRRGAELRHDFLESLPRHPEVAVVVRLLTRGDGILGLLLRGQRLLGRYRSGEGESPRHRQDSQTEH